MAEQRDRFARLLMRIGNSETPVVSRLDRPDRGRHDVAANITLPISRRIREIVLQLRPMDPASLAGKMIRTRLAAVAELERDLPVEGVQAGLQRASQQEKRLVGPVTATAEQRTDILARDKAGAFIRMLSRLDTVSRATVM